MLLLFAGPMGAMGAMRTWGSIGERSRVRGMRRAGDPAGSQTADEREIRNRNVRRAERRAAVDDGDWKL